MAIEVKIPPLGESISSGVLSKWLVKDGDIVKAGQPIFELETDKITSEGTAEKSGRITLKVPEGAEVPIGAVVASIDESVSVPEAPSKTENTSTGQPVTSAAASSASHSMPQSPAVKRIASETGINPDAIQGSGKEGRVTKGDMLAALENNKASTVQAAASNNSGPQAIAPSTSPTTSVGERTTRKKMSPLRRRIAQRLVQSQHEAALLTTFNEVDMGSVMAIRKKYQETFLAKHGVKLGFMSFFVKAVVKSLKAIPQLNAQVEGEDIIENHYYDVGVAVGTDRGLFVPVLRDCDTKSMAQIEKDLVNYAKKARDGKISLEDMQGGVFTITNGGIYGSMLSTPIINPPQSGILGMHSIKERPMVVNGEIVARPMMYLALTYDHRIVDGKEAVTFLTSVRDALEDPTLFLLDL